MARLIPRNMLREYKSPPLYPTCVSPPNPAKPPNSPTTPITPPNPNLAHALALIGASQLPQARALLTRVLAKEPANSEANSLMALVCLREGQPARAAFYGQRAAAAHPTSPQLWVNLARAHATDNNIEKALAAADKALSLNPAHHEAYEVAALALAKVGRFLEAKEKCLAGLVHHPGSFPLRMTLANTNIDCGQPEAAVDALIQLCKDYPDDPTPLDVLCNALNYDSRASLGQLFEKHRAYGALVARLRPDCLPPVSPASRKGKTKLRIGIISPDLKSHSCAYFIEPFFEFHDRAKFELFAYHTNAAADATTKRLASLCHTFRHEFVISDENLAKMIRADGIDIAIELSGHTRGDSLVAMHLRPAPVQVTYLGYPNITGLDAIDYRLVDSITDPPELAMRPEGSKAEAFEYLDPCFLCFRPPAKAPAVAPPPSQQSGYITFGSCNALQKINTTVIDTWAAILSEVPHSRLLVKAFNLREPALQQQVRDRLAHQGIDPSRLEIMGPIADQSQHLEIYNRIDIALDTFPYNGTTTTCDALWMGVPVICLKGLWHASRVSASLLHASGLSTIGPNRLIAESREEYIVLARNLAQDLLSAQPAVRQRAVEARAAQRDTMAASVLCDGPGFTKRVEASLTSMWSKWLELSV